MGKVVKKLSVMILAVAALTACSRYSTNSDNLY